MQTIKQNIQIRQTRSYHLNKAVLSQGHNVPESTTSSVVYELSVDKFITIVCVSKWLKKCEETDIKLQLYSLDPGEAPLIYLDSNPNHLFSKH